MSTSDPPRDPNDDNELTEPTAILRSAQSLDTFLGELVAYASRQTDHLCSLTLRRDDRRPYTAGSSHDLARMLDEHQYADDAGPCLEALDTGSPVIVADMASESRWGSFPAQAADLGVHSSMSYPVITTEGSVGALNFYALAAGPSDADRQGRASQLANQAAGALGLELRLRAELDAGAGLRAALTSRSMVDRAIGILMGQQHCSAEAAFDLMRKTSQARNLKLRDVAAQIVDSVERRTPDGRRGRY